MSIHIFQSIRFKTMTPSSNLWRELRLLQRLKAAWIALWQASLDVIISAIMLLQWQAQAKGKSNNH